MPNYPHVVKSFSVGDSVQVHPATDLFMCGVHYVTVTKLGRKYVHVFSAWHQRTFKVSPQYLTHV